MISGRRIGWSATIYRKLSTNLKNDLRKRQNFTALVFTIGRSQTKHSLAGRAVYQLCAGLGGDGLCSVCAGHMPERRIWKLREKPGAFLCAGAFGQAVGARYSKQQQCCGDGLFLSSRPAAAGFEPAGQRQNVEWARELFLKQIYRCL